MTGKQILMKSLKYHLHLFSESYIFKGFLAEFFNLKNNDVLLEITVIHHY